MKPIIQLFPRSIIHVLSIFTFASLPFISAAAVEPADQDEISLRVARLSYTEGAVTTLRFSEENWAEAPVNTPLMAGDKLYVGLGARAELQLEDEVVVRLDGDTYVTIPLLDDAVGRMEILKGRVSIHAAPVEYPRPPLDVKTPFLLASIQKQANARFDVDDGGVTEVNVRRGDVQIIQENNEFIVARRGQRIIADSPKPGSLLTTAMRAEDTFDQWTDIRDAMNAASHSRQYVSTRVSGYRDLDQYGTWVSTPEYGQAWQPVTYSNDWAPYRDGRWVWREPYGWIWVSNEPWGWVPYHYGRWVHYPSRGWLWVPKDVVYVHHYSYRRPVWQPALVSFTYADRGSYFSLTSGGYDPYVGWFALGYNDYYRPWYDRTHLRVSFGHYDYYRHNRHHFHYGYYPTQHCRYGGHGGGDNRVVVYGDVHGDVNIYENSNVRNGVTVVPQKDFESGDYSRSKPVTIQRNASPEIKLGGNALMAMSPPRTVQQKPRRASEDQATTLAASVSKHPKAYSSRPVDNEPQTEFAQTTQPRRVEAVGNAKTSALKDAPRNGQTQPQRADAKALIPSSQKDVGLSSTRSAAQSRPRSSGSLAEKRQEPRTNSVSRPRSSAGDARTSAVQPQQSQSRPTSPARVQPNSNARNSQPENRPSSAQRPRSSDYQNARSVNISPQRNSSAAPSANSSQSRSIAPSSTESSNRSSATSQRRYESAPPNRSIDNSMGNEQRVSQPSGRLQTRSPERSSSDPPQLRPGSYSLDSRNQPASPNALRVYPSQRNQPSVSNSARRYQPSQSNPRLSPGSNAIRRSAPSASLPNTNSMSRSYSPPSTRIQPQSSNRNGSPAYSSPPRSSRSGSSSIQRNIPSSSSSRMSSSPSRSSQSFSAPRGGSSSRSYSGASPSNRSMSSPRRGGVSPSRSSGASAPRSSSSSSPRR